VHAPASAAGARTAVSHDRLQCAAQVQAKRQYSFRMHMVHACLLSHPSDNPVPTKATADGANGFGVPLGSAHILPTSTFPSHTHSRMPNPFPSSSCHRLAAAEPAEAAAAGATSAGPPAPRISSSGSPTGSAASTARRWDAPNSASRLRAHSYSLTAAPGSVR
jgi:hypothetical protein